MNASIQGHVSALLEGRKIEPGFEGIITGGKRLRGGLTLAVFDLISNTPSKRAVALDLAAAIELAHTVSLIHDDIIDEDVERRGSASLHISLGRKRAMLEGLGLLSLPYSIASKYGPDYVRDLSEVHMRMVRGAIIELEGTQGRGGLAEYESIVELKTGSLFGLASKFGAMAAGSEPDIAERLQEFGVHIGTIYQILDDLSDLQQVREARRPLGQGSEAALLRFMDGGTDATRPSQHMTMEEWELVMEKVDGLLAAVMGEAYGIADDLSKDYPRKFSETARSRKAPVLNSIVLGISEIARGTEAPQL